MADQWFEIADLDHFWVRRRFRVLRQIAGERISAARELAEFGCGHGLLQRQVEDEYGKAVAGFDLNMYALDRNLSRRSRLYCYDLATMHARLHQRFDLIFLFDVLEHIADEDRFLTALLFHLAPAGSLIVNVPAGQWAFSNYDRAVGHIRRYSIRTLRAAADRTKLRISSWTYWGLPLVPTLILRKLWLAGRHDRNQIVSIGIDSRSPAIDRTLDFISRCERIPQQFLGTSLMAVLEFA